MGLMFVILLSCLSAVMVRGQSNVTVPQEPVKVVVGEDAILGCHLVPPLNATSLGVRWIQEVVWKRNGFTVHVYRANGDFLDNQDENFRGRTSLFRDEMARGNISLKLTNVTKRDAGTYTCHVPSSNIQVKRGNVTLIVAERREETNQGNRTNNSEPELEPEGLGCTAKIVIGTVIGTVISTVIGIGIGIGICAALFGVKYCKCRQTNAAPNEDNELEPLRERNGENQRDSEPEAEAEAEPEAEAEADAEAEPEAHVEAEAEAEPEPEAHVEAEAEAEAEPEAHVEAEAEAEPEAEPEPEAHIEAEAEPAK